MFQRIAGRSGSRLLTLDYQYDRLYRLTSATFPSGGTTTYGYDPVGNRSSMVRGGNTTNYSYDRADRITTAGAVSYTVNANGNVTLRGTDAFTYDQANRLKSATIGGGTSTYAYDGDGKRASRTPTGGSTVSYAHDVNRSLPVVLDDGARKYVWGLGLAYSVDITGGVIGVYHADGLGSVRAVTDSTGSVVQTYQADEFGVATLTQGTSAQPFSYTGEQRDAESGFVHLRTRMYDPSIGRFLSRDPTAGSPEQPLSLNRYSYAFNSPLTLADPGGLSPNQSRVLGDLCFHIDQDTLLVRINPLCARTETVSVGPQAPRPLIPPLTIPGLPRIFPWTPPALPAPRPGFQNPWLPGSTVLSAVTSAPMVLYRVLGETSEQVGRWLTATRPTSAALARSTLSLPPSNPATFYQEVLVPAGTRIQVGITNGLWGNPGRGLQIELLDNIPSTAFGPLIPLAQ
jgi:RHS repeat-associated protein